MASWEEVACCEPVITPIRESASVLADHIFSECDADTIRIARDPLLRALDPSGNSSPFRLLITLHLPMGDRLAEPIKRLWPASLNLPSTDYDYRSDLAKEICAASQDLEKEWIEHQGEMIRLMGTPGFGVAGIDRLAVECLTSHDCQASWLEGRTQVDRRNLVFLLWHESGMKPKDIRDRWNAEFPESAISLDRNGRTLISTGRCRALELISFSKKREKTSALDVH